MGADLIAIAALIEDVVVARLGLVSRRIEEEIEEGFFLSVRESALFLHEGDFAVEIKILGVGLELLLELLWRWRRF